MGFMLAVIGFFWCYMLSLLFLWAWKWLRGSLELLWNSPTIHNTWKMVIFISNNFYNSMEDWCANQNLFSAVKSFNKHEYRMCPQFGGDGCFQLRWQLLFCIRTWQIIQFGGGATMLAVFFHNSDAYCSSHKMLNLN